MNLFRTSFLIGISFLLSNHSFAQLNTDQYNNITLGSSLSITSDYSKSFAIGNDITLYHQDQVTNVFALGNFIHNESGNAIVIGQGINSSNKLYNNSWGLSVGFNSNIPTFYVGYSNGLNTTGNVGIATTNPLEKFEVNGAIRLGNTSNTNNGTLRFTGTDFEGYVGGQWRSLTATTSGGSGTWALNGTHLYSSNTGNVGIGTTTPLAKLQIGGDLLIEGKMGAMPIIYNSLATTEQNKYLLLLNSPGYESASGLKAGGILVSDAYDYGNPGKNDLIVKGNVGIGTASMTHKLTVAGSAMIGSFSSQNTLTIASTGYPELIFSTPSEIGTMKIGMLHADDLSGYGFNKGDMYFFSAATDRMDLVVKKAGGVVMGLKGGNVGIGVSNATAKVEVKGSMVIGNAQNGQRWIFDSRYYANGDYLLIAGDKADGSYDLDKTFSIERATGKVSIGGGLTTPGTYRLYVKGGILTEKVKVAVANSGNWADYVFAPEYSLRPLSEVEVFIKKNKHLPEVPSAEEVVKNGIDMAEMDALLLKKVEELTLYMIEQNKRIEKLEKENAELKQRTN